MRCPICGCNDCCGAGPDLLLKQAAIDIIEKRKNVYTAWAVKNKKDDSNFIIELVSAIRREHDLIIAEINELEQK